MSEQSSVYMASRTQVNVYNKQQVLYYFNTNKPFNLDAIFHRIQFLLHKSELNRNLKKWNGYRKRTEQIVLDFRLFW